MPTANKPEPPATRKSDTMPNARGTAGRRVVRLSRQHWPMLTKVPIGRAAMVEFSEDGQLLAASEPVLSVTPDDAAKIEVEFKLEAGTLAKIMTAVHAVGSAPTAGIRKFLADWYLDEIELPKVSYLFRGAWERFGIDGARRLLEYCGDRNRSINNIGRTKIMPHIEAIERVAQTEKIKAATNQHAG